MKVEMYLIYVKHIERVINLPIVNMKFYKKYVH